MTDKPKFKQTEVGLIPSDWEVKALSELCECNRSSTLSLPKEFVYVDLESVYQGKLLKKQIIKACDAPSRAQRFFEKGDILYQTVRPYQRNNLKVDFDAKNYIASTGYAVLHCKESLLNSDYLYQYIHTDRFVDVVMDNCSGTSYPAINPKTLMTFNIIIPSSFEEQTAIASALSDVDTLINNLEKLIAKKKNIKQGAMQQLLTGKKRLPGFGSDERTGSRPTDERRKECHSERSAKREVEEFDGYKMTELGLIPSDWEVKPIKELGLFLGGGTPSTKNESFWKGNIPWISSADLNDDDIEHISMTRFITQEAVNFSATQICPQGTILIIARVGVGKLALSQQKVCTSQDFCNLIPSKENDSKFLAYALLPVMKRMSNESQGTSIKGVAVDEIKKVQIIVPSSKAEQIAIANVLSDMDTEISALETKLAKYRQLKTGMMQQLLTGRVRLI